ncbi:MAG: hypothetical protein NTY48_03425 [Candidatus Diapherotrites archaeon]|nr:hypothetical protein [Candidatus Diapherotrites archaeon]
MAARGELFKHGCEVIYADVLFLVVLAFFSVAYGAVAEAIGLLGMGELYFVLGILYLFVIIVAVMIYGRKRSSPRFEF